MGGGYCGVRSHCRDAMTQLTDAAVVLHRNCSLVQENCKCSKNSYITGTKCTASQGQGNTKAFWYNIIYNYLLCSLFSFSVLTMRMQSALQLQPQKTVRDIQHSFDSYLSLVGPLSLLHYWDSAVSQGDAALARARLHPLSLSFSAALSGACSFICTALVVYSKFLSVWLEEVAQ